MMSKETHNALLARRPGLRTLVITRSTFAGAGTFAQKWLGDNLSDDYHYLNSISGILNMASIFQVPVVGADVCGYGGASNENLCARWAMLGAFYPFYRNVSLGMGLLRALGRKPDWCNSSSIMNSALPRKSSMFGLRSPRQRSMLSIFGEPAFDVSERSGWLNALVLLHSYRLMDYMYTAIHQGHLDGTPVLNPYWYLYPTDKNTFGIDSQFFYGPSILV